MKVDSSRFIPTAIFRLQEDRYVIHFVHLGGMY